jgi:superfamily II DNA or RNA helicase
MATVSKAIFDPGMVVRLKHDPSRAGQITGDTRIQAERCYWAVRMANGSGIDWLPEAQLVADTDTADAFDDFKNGRFSPPEALQRLLLHHRLTGRLREIIYSMDVTDTEFHAYQFKPVIKVLSSPSQGLLIADEVGLGKTIEAGLIWTELVARFDCHRLLVVCPKSLTEKWRLELWQKFSVDAKIVDAGELHDYLKRQSERSDGFALIASLPALRPPKGWEEEGDSKRAKLARYLAELAGQDPVLDCLIFDEAHHLRNSDTASHAFARLAMDVADYKLLLSATPINLHSEDLRNLLRLLDPETFENAYMFDALEAENRPLVAARELALNPRASFADILDAVRSIPRGELLKIDRQLDNLIRELGRAAAEDSKAQRNRIAAQLEEMSLLGSIVNRTRRRDVNDLKVERRVHHHLWEMNPTEKAFYDAMSDIVREHAWTLDANERFLLATPQRLIASSLPAACRHWAKRAASFSLDDPDEEETAASPLVAKLAGACDDPALLATLDAGDTKFGRLMYALDQNWTHDEAEKLIVFSSFRVTLDYLAEKLRTGGVPVELMHGGIKEDRTAILARFQSADGRCVLLTSEVGGEGLDMQFCRSLINYDLPWNPMKVEQRIGRVDRIGQSSPSVSVISLICANTIEERIYERLYQRLLTIEQVLGAFESILGSEIADLERRLLDPQLTPEELDAEIERRALAIEARQQQEDKLEEEAPGLIAHGDMILDRIEESHRPERQISGEELADYICEALSVRYPGTRVDDVPEEPGLYDVTLSANAQLALKNVLSRGGRARTRLNRETRIRAAFERRPNLPKSIERISTVHPLTRLAANARKEAQRDIALQPVVHLLVHASAVDVRAGLYVAAVQKWFVDGAVRLDALAYAASQIGGAMLDAIAAEALVQSALREGKMIASSDVPAVAVEAAVRLRDEILHSGFDQFVEQEAARHEDRAATGLARIEQQRDKRVRDAEWKLSEWKRSGDPRKLRLIPAEQGKLDKFVARLDHRKHELEAARDRFSFKQDLVGLALIKVGSEG